MFVKFAATKTKGDPVLGNSWETRWRNYKSGKNNHSRCVPTLFNYIEYRHRNYSGKKQSETELSRDAQEKDQAQFVLHVDKWDRNNERGRKLVNRGNYGASMLSQVTNK